MEIMEQIQIGETIDEDSSVTYTVGAVRAGQTILKIVGA